MENLSDAEFGSDNSGEEAPILIAQRYLNIFRQVHIFNKAKRDEFDDDLLAQPPAVVDFFKKMPGGRLLVEHIEKVKTERGISFVKANKADFDESAGVTDMPNGFQGVGSVVIDSSFAETLAQSMAAAFKQTPLTAPVSGSSGGNADFGNAFDIIAEEIRTSRASLLDVLKETRSITDSVIASQVSISRILEGILSARNRDEADVANLNNRIIASQASITKLLEGLYTSHTQKNDEISDYLNVENKLQSFKQEIKNEVNSALYKMQEMFSEYAKTVSDRKVIIETKESPYPPQPRPFDKPRHEEIAPKAQPFPERPSFEEDFDSHEEQISEIQNRQRQQFQPATPAFEYKEARPNVRLDVNSAAEQNDELRKKKKKKKKNRDNENLSTDDRAGIAAQSRENPGMPEHVKPAFQRPLPTEAKPQARPHQQQATQPNLVRQGQAFGNEIQPKRENTASKEEKTAIPAFGGVIRNQAYKHEDNFDNVRLDEPPLDEPFDTFNQNLKSNSPTNLDADVDASSLDLLQDFDLSEDDLDFALPTQAKENTDKKPAETIPEANLDDFASDGLDFALPRQTQEERTDETVTDTTPTAGLDDFASDDLDFALPEQTQEEQADETDTAPTASLDDFASDGLDLALSKSNDATHDNIDALSQFMADDFAQNSQATASKQSSATSDAASDELDSDLESFLTNTEESGSNILFSDENSSAQNMQPTEDTSVSVAGEEANNVKQNPATLSRYSAELERIRQALTTDNVDLNALDEPIALDEYSDDENVHEDGDLAPVTDMDTASADNNNDDWEYEYVEDDGSTETPSDKEAPAAPESDSDEDWEWEYVEDDGNKTAEGDNDEDWEWEYVEDDGAADAPDNNKQ